MSAGPFFRVYSVLGDGRKVYYSKRGHVELMDRREAAFCVRSKPSDAVDADPLVYSPDLGLFANRSLFLESLSPFVAVVSRHMEPAEGPIDPEAFIMGEVRAADAGTIRKGRVIEEGKA